MDNTLLLILDYLNILCFKLETLLLIQIYCQLRRVPQYFLFDFKLESLILIQIYCQLWRVPQYLMFDFKPEIFGFNSDILSATESSQIE